MNPRYRERQIKLKRETLLENIFLVISRYRSSQTKLENEKYSKSIF